jgi:hypothetical protein
VITDRLKLGQKIRKKDLAFILLLAEKLSNYRRNERADNKTNLKVFEAEKLTRKRLSACDSQWIKNCFHFDFCIYKF